MARYKIEIKKSAVKELESIPSNDLKRILSKIESLAENPRPIGSLKLSGDDRYRIRQGNYRILYTIQDDILTIYIVKVRHRKDAYNWILSRPYLIFAKMQIDPLLIQIKWTKIQTMSLEAESKGGTSTCCTALLDSARSDMFFFIEIRVSDQRLRMTDSIVIGQTLCCSIQSSQALSHFIQSLWPARFYKHEPILCAPLRALRFH